jgi:hypothetical protein
MDDFSLAQRTVQTSLCMYRNFRKARFLKQREGPYTSSESALVSAAQSRCYTALGTAQMCHLAIGDPCEEELHRIRLERINAYRSEYSIDSNVCG